MLGCSNPHQTLLCWGVLAFFLYNLRVKKCNFKKTPKSYLALSGISIAIFVISVVLHNFFYALGIITRHKPVFRFVFKALHVFFFLVSVPVAPLLFIVRILGAVILFIKKLLKR